MSTTVTYKGNTLATVSNATKTLKTAGKYMEGDVILTDTSASSPTIQSLSITPSESAQTFNASGVDGYKPVNVSAIPTISDYTLDIVNGSFYTENNNRKFRQQPQIVSTETGYLKFQSYLSIFGDYNIYNAIASNTTITPTESSQTIGGSRYVMEGAITISAIPSDYVGSGITQRDSTDLTVSGATVTAPAGYYAEAASKSVSSMTLPTSAASSATSGYTSKATIGRSTAAQYINIPPGYNSTGAYYVISAVANGSATAPASISGTAASISTGTNTLTLTKTVSVTPTVSAGYVSSGTAGNSSVSLTASVTTKAAATITPTTTNQTIAAGTYLTGTQTIAGDADLVGSNILSTANIFGVQGTVDFVDVYIRSAAPTSSVGSDGDIYIQE